MVCNYGLRRISQIRTHSIDFSVLSKIFINYFLVVSFEFSLFSLTLLEAFLNRKQVQYEIFLLPKRLEFHCSLTAKLSFIGFKQGPTLEIRQFTYERESNLINLCLQPIKCDYLVHANGLKTEVGDSGPCDYRCCYELWELIRRRCSLITLQ